MSVFQVIPQAGCDAAFPYQTFNHVIDFSAGSCHHSSGHPHLYDTLPGGKEQQCGIVSDQCGPQRQISYGGHGIAGTLR